LFVLQLVEVVEDVELTKEEELIEEVELTKEELIE
jgi:hypothetical protein